MCGKQQLEYQTIKQCFNRINDKQLYGTSTPYDVIREELDNDLSKEDYLCFIFHYILR